MSATKLQRAEDLTRQIISSGEKVVIFSTFKEPIYELQRMMQDIPHVVATGDFDDSSIEVAKEKF